VLGALDTEGRARFRASTVEGRVLQVTRCSFMRSASDLPSGLHQVCGSRRWRACGLVGSARGDHRTSDADHRWGSPRGCSSSRPGGGGSRTVDRPLERKQIGERGSAIDHACCRGILLLTGCIRPTALKHARLRVVGARGARRQRDHCLASVPPDLPAGHPPPLVSAGAPVSPRLITLVPR